MANDGIKFELDHKLPLQSDYQELLASLKEEDNEANLVQYEDFCQSFNVIAAYDQGRLIGLGRAAVISRTTNEGQQCHITVLKQYRGRDIGSYMRKLLSIRYM